MNNKERTELLKRIKNREVITVVFEDDSLLDDAYNGYRNDGGFPLYTTFYFKGTQLVEIEEESEYMRGYKRAYSDIYTLKEALYQLYKALKVEKPRYIYYK